MQIIFETIFWIPCSIGNCLISPANDLDALKYRRSGTTDANNIYVAFFKTNIIPQKMFARYPILFFLMGKGSGKGEDSPGF